MKLIEYFRKEGLKKTEDWTSLSEDPRSTKRVLCRQTHIYISRKLLFENSKQIVYHGCLCRGWFAKYWSWIGFQNSQTRGNWNGVLEFWLFYQPIRMQNIFCHHRQWKIVHRVFNFKTFEFDKDADKEMIMLSLFNVSWRLFLRSSLLEWFMKFLNAPPFW